jgi:hypothetical protein
MFIAFRSNLVVPCARSGRELHARTGKPAHRENPHTRTSLEGNPLNDADNEQNFYRYGFFGTRGTARYAAFYAAALHGTIITSPISPQFVANALRPVAAAAPLLRPSPRTARLLIDLNRGIP